MTDQLQLAVNHAVNDLRTAAARLGLVNRTMGLDAKRSAAWCEYGFKDQLTFEDFHALYARGGVAHGAVEKLIGNCWKSAPWLIEGDDQDKAEDETAWERALKPLLNGGRFWRAIAEADRRRLVGRYSGLLLQIRDSQGWDQPVTRSGAEVVKLIPTWAGSLKPVEFDNDEKSETFGQPKKWQYIESGVNGQRGRQIDVHPDRVFIFGDWATDAIGFLEPAFNAFVSLEKVEGGSGESFLKNAARHLSVNFDKEVNLQGIAQMYGVSIEQLQVKFNDAARDINRGNDVMLITQGATATPLVSNIPDPTPTYNVNLQTAAAAVDIPTKILVGMQTGERASSEDQKYFNARSQSRRVLDLAFEIHDLIKHLIRIKVVKAIGEFTVMWDDLNEPSKADKLANAKGMSDINNVSLSSGEAVFSAEEIREAAGYDPLTEPLPLPEKDETEDPAADPANKPG